ncbi:MAG: hypothetical protein NUV81_01315 [bacterium]|nr:hypothetical protein [bacterium]
MAIGYITSRVVPRLIERKRSADYADSDWDYMFFWPIAWVLLIAYVPYRFAESHFQRKNAHASALASRRSLSSTDEIFVYPEEALDQREAQPRAKFDSQSDERR